MESLTVRRNHTFRAKPSVVVIMGVAGAGKTTVGRALAEAAQWEFYDADDFHPPANIERMKRGEPLTDETRAPWLERLCRLIAEVLDGGRQCVLACSALKQAYRDALVPSGAAPGTVSVVYLDVPVSVLRERLVQREHYFRVELLDSQLATLERPTDALVVDGTLPVDEIVRIIGHELGI